MRPAKGVRVGGWQADCLGTSRRFIRSGDVCSMLVPLFTGLAKGVVWPQISTLLQTIVFFWRTFIIFSTKIITL